ncbi:Vacuolar protein-sorting-associated protein 25, partial [Perkinsus olseni]
VLWHTPAEWAQIIYDWATNTGKLGSVETVFSLHSGEDSQGAKFHGIPPEVIMLGLENLELAGKCEIFRGNTTDATVHARGEIFFSCRIPHFTMSHRYFYRKLILTGRYSCGHCAQGIFRISRGNLAAAASKGSNPAQAFARRRLEQSRQAKGLAADGKPLPDRISFDKDYLGLQADLMYSLNDLGGSTVNSAAPSGIRGSINVLLNRADTGYVRKIVKFANTVTGSTILSTTGCYFLGYMDIYDTIPFVTALATMWVGLHVYLTTYVSRIVVDTGKAQMAIRAHNLSGRPGRPIVFPVHGMEKVEVGDKYIRFRTKKQFWTISRIFPFRVPRIYASSDSDRYDNLSKDLVTTSDLGQDYFQLNNTAVSTEVLNPGLPALASPDGRRSDGKRAKFLGAGVGVAASAQSQLGRGRGNTTTNDDERSTVIAKALSPVRNWWDNIWKEDEKERVASVRGKFRIEKYKYQMPDSADGVWKTGGIPEVRKDVLSLRLGRDGFPANSGEERKLLKFFEDPFGDQIPKKDLHV